MTSTARITKNSKLISIASTSLAHSRSCELWKLKGDLPAKRSSHRVLPAEADDMPIWLSGMVSHNQIHPADDGSTTIDLNLYRHYHSTWFKA